MNQIKLALLAALVGASTAALAAADMGSDAAREQRMDEALQGYRNGAPHDTASGRAARSEESVKRGLGKAGSGIKRGAHKAGHAVEKGARKTGDAIRRTGKKMGGSDETSK